MSYSSVLSSSILSRRQALYAAHGFDVSRWSDLMDENKTLRREIQKIAIDYDVGWKEDDEIKEEDGDDEDLKDAKEDASDKNANKDGGKVDKSTKMLMSDS